MQRLSSSQSPDPSPPTAAPPLRRVVATSAASPQSAPANDAAAPGLTRDKLLLLATGLAGSSLVSLSGQFASVNIADVQGALAASADEASWASTLYLMGNLGGVVLAVAMIQTFGLRRFLVVNTTLFALAGAGGALTSSLELLTWLRAMQGVAAGGFGPAAFVATFMVMNGPRLAKGASLLAVALTVPVMFGPVVSGLVEDQFGWRSLFVAQALIGVGLGAAAWAWFPRQPIAWERLKIDWVAALWLAVGLAALALVVNQGTRRFWLENGTVAGAAAIGLAALAAFAVTVGLSSQPLINPRLLLRRDFGLAIGSYSLFRFALLAAVFLIPQTLLVVQGYRPLQTAGVLAWAVAAQVATAPVVWRLMQRLDGRVLMAAGLALCAFAMWRAGQGTNLEAADQLHVPMVLLGAGSMLFILPGLVSGTRVLTPPDLPTASITFNISTFGAGALGSALFNHLSTEREKLHSNALTETLSAYQPLDADRLSNLASAFAGRLADDDAAGLRAAATLAARARREAWVLAFNDSFAVLSLVFALGVLVVFLMRRSPPLPRPRAPEVSEIKSMKSRHVALLSVGAAAVTLALGVIILVPSARPAGAGQVGTDNAYVRGDVTQISPKVAGYVVEEPIQDNQTVRRGDVLLRIDPADYTARVDQAAAAVAKAKAALGALDSRLAQQQAVIAQADAAGRSADAAAVRSQRALQRTQTLVSGGWVSQARFDDVQAETRGAAAQVAEARANAAAARSQIAVLESQRPQLQADIETAEAALRLTRIDLDNTAVRAPVDGRVGERQARVGQYVRAGTQVMALVPHDIWIVANFKETQIRDMREGDAVSVRVDAVPGAPLHGRIDSLSPASGAQFALLPPDNATGNFTRIVQRIPVKVTLDREQPGLDRLRPGMSARVSVLTD